MRRCWMPAIIAAARQVEHYEITSYGSLIAWAEILGYSVALPLLQANEWEERAADATLGQLAHSYHQSCRRRRPGSKPSAAVSLATK